MRAGRWLCGLAFAVVCVASARAENLGNLVLTVLGPEGIALGGATIEAASSTQVGIRRATTPSSGVQALLGLPPGTYDVRVSLAGFQPVQESVAIVQDRTQALLVTLVPEAFHESVEVTAAASSVDTRSATTSSHVTVAQVEAIPVGRDYRAYPQLVPGVSVVPNSEGVETRYEPVSKAGNYYHDRGAALGSRDNVYYLDGFNITDMGGGFGSATVNNDAILEEEVITSGLPAEYSGGAGYVANIVTRVGGPQLSGTVSYYFQQPGMYADFKTDDSRLRTVRENKFDTGFTLGGPLLADRAWFFVAGQQRENSDDVPLSTSASPTPRTETYSYRRRNALAKLVLRPSDADMLTLAFHGEARKTSGTRDVNTPPNRYNDTEEDWSTFGASYQRLLGQDALADSKVFAWRRVSAGVPADPGAGPTNTILYEPGRVVPAYERDLGSSGDSGRGVQRKKQASVSLTRFLRGAGTHQVKGGVQWLEWEESNGTEVNFGYSLTSLASHLTNLTFAQARDFNLLPQSEFDYIYRSLVAAPASSAFHAADANGDGTVSAEEYAALRFSSTAGNLDGVNFMRQSLAHAGVNNVGETAWSFFLQDDWRLKHWSINLGVRAEKLRYVASDGSTILSMSPAWYPRLGVALDIGGSGRQTLSFAYGRYADPLLTPMIRFAGNLSGSIWDDQVFIGDDWFTYRTRGSATLNRDAGFAPNLKNELETELQLAYTATLRSDLRFSAQLYHRRDDNLIEDYDPAVYFNPAVSGSLALTPATFGYPPSGSGAVNYFLGNLVGGKRRAWGVDLSLERRFADNWSASVQYSWKRAKGNSNSNGAADLQGDFLFLDPRQPYMYGGLPGTIPHQVKIFGSYLTPWRLEIGGLLYWASGAVFTESDIFRPVSHAIYYNHRRGDGTYVRTGTERYPGYHTLDLRFGYSIPIRRVGELKLVLDVMNALDNQDAIRIEEAHNNPEFTVYREPRLLLEPRRTQIGVAFTW